MPLGLSSIHDKDENQIAQVNGYANARLIVASPEMYEVLEEVAQYLLNLDDNSTIARMVENARTIIAKVTSK
jgi:hypothetical protein